MIKGGLFFGLFGREKKIISEDKKPVIMDMVIGLKDIKLRINDTPNISS